MMASSIAKEEMTLQSDEETSMNNLPSSSQRTSTVRSAYIKLLIKKV